MGNFNPLFLAVHAMMLFPLELIGSLKKIDSKTEKVMIDPKTGKEVDKDYIFPCPHGAKQKPIDTRALAHAVRKKSELAGTALKLAAALNTDYRVLL